MQIPIETLSLITTRADSGGGAKQKASQNQPSGHKFGKVLAGAMADIGPAPADSKKTAPADKMKPEAANAKKPAIADAKKPIAANNKKPAAEAAKKDDPSADGLKPDAAPDETLAAGMMGNQESNVFILEGDKESATLPETLADTKAGAVNPDAAQNPAMAETKTVEAKPESDKTVNPDEQIAQDTVFKPEVTDAATAKAPAAQQADTIEAPIVAEQIKTTAAKSAKADTEAKPNSALDKAAGEVTARMPEIRTSERQETEEDNSEFSKNGDLSPLENENDDDDKDNAPVKGQKEKTYSGTEDNVRGAADAAKNHVHNIAPPLADGIKPEQFRADQQMRQATADRPVSKENLFEEMVSRIDTMQTDSARTMTIQLKPEFMGKVALEIAMDATGLHVRIDAANSEIRSLINGQLNTLIESLHNKGIEVAEVEVAYTGVNNGAFKDSRENQAQPDRPRRYYRGGVDPSDSAAYYAALPIETLDYYPDAGVSSVEYRA